MMADKPFPIRRTHLTNVTFSLDGAFIGSALQASDGFANHAGFTSFRWARGALVHQTNSGRY